MGKIVNFPKDDIYNYQKGLNSYNLGNYYEAYQSFLKTLSGKTLKEKSIKYIVECLIELKEYNKVYKIIENEFVEKRVDEDFLIQKYIFTMYLEGLYEQVIDIIKVYKDSKQCSRDLLIFFDELVQIIEIKVQHDTQHKPLSFREWLSSNNFLEQMKVVTNIEHLDLETYRSDLLQFLQNQVADPQIKYILLKYLIDHDGDGFVYRYVNKDGHKFTIFRDEFIDLYECEEFQKPIQLVRKHITSHYPEGEHYLKNIWLAYCLNVYPDLSKDHNVSAALLHCMLLKSMNVRFNVNDICNKYKVDISEVNFRSVH